MTVALPPSEFYQEEITQTITNQLFNNLNINSIIESASSSSRKNLSGEKKNTKMITTTPTRTIIRRKIGISASEYILSSSEEFPVSSSASEKAVKKIDQSNTWSTSVVHSRRWALGTMIMFLLFVLSFSTSSVSCVPLGIGTMSHFEELTSIPQQQENPTAQKSPTVEGVGAEIDESPRNYMVQQISQLYLPSLLKSSDIGIGDEPSSSPRYGQQQEQEQDDLRSYFNRKSSLNYHHHQNLQSEDDSTGTEWETVIDPHLYVLTEWNSNPQLQQRMRRNVGPSLSIVNPLDVLRQRLLLEIARRKMRQSHNQIMANAEILKSIGRR